MFKILRYLILITIISSGYYVFISEYLNLSDKRFLDKEIVKKEIITNKEEIIQEKQEDIISTNIKKNIDSTKFHKVIHLYLFWKI